jgi:hypothetical protein
VGPLKGEPTFENRAQCVCYLEKRITDAWNAGIELWCDGTFPSCARCIDENEFYRLQASEQHPTLTDIRADHRV